MFDNALTNLKGGGDLKDLSALRVSMCSFASSLSPGNSSLASYFASKILAFKTPLPLGILTDLS